MQSDADSAPAMIEQQGQAVSVSVAAGSVSVRLGGRSGCAACEAGRGCGAGVFGKLLRRRPVVLELDNRVGARSGQAVIVGVPEALFLRLVARFYLFPVLAGLAGAAIGHYLGVKLGFEAGGRDALALLAGAVAAALVLRRNRSAPAEFAHGTALRLLRVAAPPDLEETKEVVS